MSCARSLPPGTELNVTFGGKTTRLRTIDTGGAPDVTSRRPLTIELDTPSLRRSLGIAPATYTSIWRDVKRSLRRAQGREWPAPWWARLIGWGIVAYYALAGR